MDTVTDEELLDLTTRLADQAVLVSGYLAEVATEARDLAQALAASQVPDDRRLKAKAYLERSLAMLDGIRREREG